MFRLLNQHFPIEHSDSQVQVFVDLDIRQIQIDEIQFNKELATLCVDRTSCEISVDKYRFPAGCYDKSDRN